MQRNSESERFMAELLSDLVYEDDQSVIETMWKANSEVEDPDQAMRLAKAREAILRLLDSGFAELYSLDDSARHIDRSEAEALISGTAWLQTDVSPALLRVFIRATPLGCQETRTG